MSALDSYVAVTTEVDDGVLAVNEILAQVPLEKLGKNTLGIVACHYEFVFSGVFEALATALPFEVVGTISSAQGAASGVDSFELALTVLSSDEVQFATMLSEPLEGEVCQKIGAAYQSVAENLGTRPDLLLLHGPFMLQNNGDDYLAELDRVSGRVPLFGTLAVDDTADFRYCFSLYNGKSYNNRLVLTALKGVTPHFYSASIVHSKIVGNPALITASEGALLQTVNGRPLAEYLADLGLATLAENGYAMASMPFILDYGDGTPPISRVFIQLTPDGSAILNGSVPVGARVSLGSFDKADALATTCDALDDALAQIDTPGNAGVLLAYSCIARSMALGSDYLEELELVRQQVGGKLPFMMAYSGGEYCPTEQFESTAVNRFHNNAFIVCVF